MHIILQSFMASDFEICILGISSATPTRDRHPSGQFVRIDGTYFLLDCGEGIQRQLIRFGLRLQRIKYILITHLHGDHFLGLPGLITTMALNGRQEELIIVGPPKLKEIIDTILLHTESYIPYEIKYYETNHLEFEKILPGNQWDVYSIPLKHRVHTTGFIIKENSPAYRLNKESIEKNKIPHFYLDRIKNGEDYIDENGNIIKNELLILDKKINRSYAYISDTIYDESIIPHIENVSALYHESTYLEDKLDQATERFHSTAKQAATIAKKANVGSLYVGHFSARYKTLEGFEVEAKSVFENSIICNEGLRINL